MTQRTKKSANNSKLNIIHSLLFAALILITLARPIALVYSPPGFYVDEAIGAANIISVRETGRNLRQESFPLYTLAGGGGFVTPTYMYSGVVWSAVFGDNEYAFRLHSLFYTLLAIAILMYVAYLWWGREAAIVTGLVASLIPWSWHQGVLAWDPALIPFWISLTLAGWSYIRTRGWSTVAWGIMLAGFVGAAYTYPPTRITVAILGPIFVLSLWKHIKSHWVSMVLGGILAALSMVPLLQFSLTPTALGRAGFLTVWGPGAREAFGVEGFWGGVMLAGKNMLQLSNPVFLFFSGDSNLRHGTQTGMLGLGSFSILIGALALLFQKKKKQPKGKGKNSTRLLFVIIIVSILASYLGSALTWEGQPHSLRAISAWPFYALLMGWGLSRIIHAGANYWKPVLLVYAIVTSLFLWHYHTQFIQIAGPSFDEHIRPDLIEAAKSNRPNSEIQYVGDAYTYYLIRYGDKTF